MKTEILEHLQKITEQLKISDKKQLDKIYLEIKSEDKITRINLGNMDIDNKHTTITARAFHSQFIHTAPYIAEKLDCADRAIMNSV